MRHPFDGINPTASQPQSVVNTPKHSRRSVLGKMLAALAGIFGATAVAKACEIDVDPNRVTTMMAGEEGGRFPITTADIPSEGGGPVTKAAPEVESGGRPTTLREGEEGGRPSTKALGEEGGRPSTTAAREEGGARPTTLREGEEGGRWVTTLRSAEEGGDRNMTTALIPSETGWQSFEQR